MDTNKLRKMNKLIQTLIFIFIVNIIYCQVLFLPSARPNLPEETIGFNTNEYELGMCSYANNDTIKVCECHTTDLGKIKIALLSDDLPTSTGIIQYSFRVVGNKIEILYVNRQGIYEKFTWQFSKTLKKIILVKNERK